MVQVPDASDELIGTGISFPLQADQRGVLALSHGVTDIEQAIRMILGTAPGERPMRPEFGCAVHDLVFDTIDAEMVGKVEAAVHRALARWEPRIDVESLDFDLAEVDQGKLDHHDHVPRGDDQPALQPRVPVLCDPRGGDCLMHRVRARLARPRGVGRGGAPTPRARLSGAQRQRWPRRRRDIDRTVRVDDRPRRSNGWVGCPTSSTSRCSISSGSS